jgi:hypothetical protein
VSLNKGTIYSLDLRYNETKRKINNSVFFNATAESIEEGLIDGSTLVAREGGQPEMAFVNFASYGALEKSLGELYCPAWKQFLAA